MWLFFHMAVCDTYGNWWFYPTNGFYGCYDNGWYNNGCYDNGCYECSGGGNGYEGSGGGQEAWGNGYEGRGSGQEAWGGEKGWSRRRTSRMTTEAEKKVGCQSAWKWLNAPPKRASKPAAQLAKPATPTATLLSAREWLDGKVADEQQALEPATTEGDRWIGVVLALAARTAVNLAYENLHLAKRVHDAARVKDVLSWFDAMHRCDVVAEAYKVVHNITLGAARHPRRAIRDLWVWRACRTVGYCSQKELMNFATETFGGPFMGNNLRAQLLLSYDNVMRNGVPRMGVFMSNGEQWKRRKGDKARPKRERIQQTRTEDDYYVEDGCDDGEHVTITDQTEPKKIKYPQWSRAFQMGSVAGRMNKMPSKANPKTPMRTPAHVVVTSLWW